ncbi:(E3-independent) E2 ubiquitin-conjugating enzyme [Ascochyta rabiei]|uniref:(E3-independent) E2 ubiquitin-conjugating enzyme n=1 Tax=Didymella rabiei TaxID=5454 RepID=UPI0018FF55ED|nr:(E3-independent) E2 ubiquitin-conjugating enzyme [Ascochyta rabiei]UPX20242.1 (E3-independent) E2 ubiquitin-conjugating enzyme [Ascochyta rabiei]
MDGQKPRADQDSPSPPAREPTADHDCGLVHGFLSRLFQDRFLASSPAAAAAPPPANNLVPFFSAASVFASPQAHAHAHARAHAHAHARAPAALAAPVTGRSSPPAPAAPMQRTHHVVFCVEDTVGLRDDKYTVGVVDRSFTDVDTHEPRPQRDYGEDIERHPDVPLAEFHKFMKTGIPPRGTVLVSWQTQLRTELIPEAALQLLDRALYVGDVVKRRAEDHMSGTVIGTTAVCTLFPASLFHSGHITQATTDDLSIRNVPANELLNVHEYVQGAIVVYRDWVGRIENVYDQVAIKLSNNSVVVVEDPAELEHDEVTVAVERLSVGDTVKTKKGNLRRGLWRYGAFDPNVKPEGIVVETRPIEVDVQWLARSIAATDTQYAAEEPPANLGRDELESASFYRYDASAGAASTLPLSPNGTDRAYHVADVAVGDRVRFKDLSAAALKYDGTHTLPNGYPQGKLTRLPRTDTLGYDMNVFLVMQTHTRVTVQWQDLTITEDVSSSLIPDPNVEDDDEVWPAEVICSKEDKAAASDVGQWMKEPLKVGIVQAVKSRDRIASVRWFKNHDIKFFGADLLRPATTGELSETAEDVSLYDIYSSPALTRRRGDFVLIHPSGVQGDLSHVSGPDWFGEVVDLGLDGRVTVRLGAAKPVTDIRVVYEKVTLAYSSDMDNEFLNTQELDGDSIEDSEEDMSDFDSASFNEMWIEYEGMEGEPPVGDEADWSTEDEEEAEEEDDDDDDTSMPDLEPTDGVDTSKTTPDPANSASTDSTNDAAAREETTETVTDALAPFLILDTPPPSSHHYLQNTSASSSAFMRRIAKEHKILRNSLPPNIFVRTWDSRLDLIRVLIIGPSDTPYEYAPFVIDFHLGSSYPQTPPEAFFHSWTSGNGPVNPNLYEDGKICLSLLGTWHTDERNESWSPAKSTLLQVLVSIMGLVLVKDPYYNEAGYDVQRAAPETRLSSALYTERAYFRARAFITHALSNEVAPFTQELQYLYRSDAPDAPRLLDKAIEAANDVVQRSSAAGEAGERDGLRTVSLGAVVMLKRQVEKLEALRQGSTST